MKYVILAIVFISCFAFSSPLEKCLSSQSENTKNCVEKNIKILTLSNCFSESEKIKSDLSRENLKQFCFYEVSEFPSMKTCLVAAEKMQVAIHHDDAVFECVRQFQDQMDLNLCRHISKKMKYPEKAEHLVRKCSQL